MGNRLTRAGQFTRPVTILRRTFTTNAHNEQVDGVPTEIPTLAAVSPAPGIERFGSAERAAEAPMRFIFRYRPGLLTVEDGLRFDGRVFAVSSVTEIGIREGLEVLAVTRADTEE